MNSYDPHWWKQHQVPEIPEGQSGEWSIKKFTIDENDFKMRMENMKMEMEPGGYRRRLVPGSYTSLTTKYEVVMSDTRAEIMDLQGYFAHLDGAESVLIAGLGLGVCLAAAIKAPSVRTIEVYENSRDVLNLTADHYKRMAALHGKHLLIFEKNIFEVMPIETIHRNFDVAWFDIWNGICGDNWEDMKLFKRRWKNRAKWVGCWCEAEVRYEATRRYR